MTDQLENDLRDALHARAAQMPDSAADRLTHLDYRPRTRGLRPPVAIGAVASAAAAGTAAVVISLSAGASNAFAGWTPTPTRPGPGQLAAAQASCEASQSPVAGLPLALADTRGPFTFAVYANSTSTATCIKGPSLFATSESQSSAPVTVPADQVQLASVHQTDRGGHGFGIAYGRAGAGVSAVTLVLDDGTQVQATVGNGWCDAWWPSGHQVSSAQLTTPAGTTTQKFDLPSPPPGPGGAGGVSSGSSMGSSSGGGTGSGFSIQGSSNSQ